MMHGPKNIKVFSAKLPEVLNKKRQVSLRAVPSHTSD